MLGLIQVLGGLGLFLFGIKMLSSGIEKLAGDQIQKWLYRVTNNRFKSAVFGAVATALVQSSSLLMVTMIGLINASLMTVEQAIGVMLGQEIGTTMTAQIVSFKIGNYWLVLVILGLVFMEFFPKRDWKKFGEIFMGLGIVFIGMGFMSSALDSLIEIPWVANSLLLLGKHTWLGILAGCYPGSQHWHVHYRFVCISAFITNSQASFTCPNHYKYCWCNYFPSLYFTVC